MEGFWRFRRLVVFFVVLFRRQDFRYLGGLGLDPTLDIGSGDSCTFLREVQDRRELGGLTGAGVQWCRDSGVQVLKIVSAGLEDLAF